MPFNGLKGDLLNLLNRFTKELLRSSANRLFVAPDFNLGHTVNDHWNSRFGIDFRRNEIQGHDFEAKDVDFLNQGKNEGAASFADAKAGDLDASIWTSNLVFQSRYNHNVVGTDFLVTTGYGKNQQK